MQIVLDELGYTAMWQADRSPDAAGRLENLKELVVAMAEFENLGGFLEHVSLVMDNAAEAGGDMVNLMTLHSAKGLEFDTVFLPGWEEGLFPNQRALEENGLTALEEERRLAYVGLTRARHRALSRSPPTAGSTANGRMRSARALSTSCRPSMSKSSPSSASSRAPCGPPAGEPPATRRNRHGLGGPARDARGLGAQPLLIESGRVPRRGEEIRRVGGFAVGGRVFHQKFGYGTVTNVEDNKLAIRFDVAGDKKVMDAYVEPA